MSKILAKGCLNVSNALCACNTLKPIVCKRVCISVVLFGKSGELWAECALILLVLFGYSLSICLMFVLQSISNSIRDSDWGFLYYWFVLSRNSNISSPVEWIALFHLVLASNESWNCPIKSVQKWVQSVEFPASDHFIQSPITSTTTDLKNLKIWRTKSMKRIDHKFYVNRFTRFECISNLMRFTKQIRNLFIS